MKGYTVYGVFTKRGRLRGHLYRKLSDARADHFPDWGDRIVKMKARKAGKG